MRWAGHVACMVERRGVYRILVGRPEGNILHAKPRYKWKNNIKVELQELGWGAWSGLVCLGRGEGFGHL